MTSLDTDSFFLKRVMINDAHEKAFEIRVTADRAFKAAKKRYLEEGVRRVDKEIDTKRQNLRNNLNI